MNFTTKKDLLKGKDVLILIAMGLFGVSILSLAYQVYENEKNGKDESSIESVFVNVDITSIEKEFTGDYYIDFSISSEISEFCTGENVSCLFLAKQYGKTVSSPSRCEVTKENITCEVRIISSLLSSDKDQKLGEASIQIKKYEDGVLNDLGESQKFNLE
ncbi:MAG: hypothetical protein US52_C0022G0009 [candidate division WS6 bacterium GW2011_GWA2_37_6]|uniref:Uncharacterized protein n=1 Tax=candidate division WS6 bacterium GW2011_GWA2_37_6 TaxID=1619087 RepID=A0A0G0HAI6_9BACT|nr:MAG: hypothetical protein US52_C0022G0009 [candidate division WS6 bacterium GW2011_GWA2_37_6]